MKLLSGDVRQNLFEYFEAEYGILLLDSDFNEMENIMEPGAMSCNPLIMRRPPTENMYDYDGEYMPDGGNKLRSNTFSVGIFKWVKKANGKGLKRTAAIKRIRGSSDFPEDVYRRAQAECDKLNAACA